jgi:hypothetical protein
MTAVACLEFKGYPLLFGDLLVSSRTAPNTTVSLPSLDVKYGPQVVVGPTGLCQKITILADNMIVGWAANRISEAADVIKGLKLHCEYEGFNLDALGQFLRGQRRELWDGLELAGFILENEKHVVFRSANCRTVDTPAFGEVALLGTGRDLLEQHLHKDFSEPVCHEDPENLAIQAVAYGMSTMGNFITMEQFACESLDNFFGGGYEIATRSFDKFVKLSDVLYAFWRATLAPDRKSVRLRVCPFLLFRYEYYGDLLAIRATTVHEQHGESHGVEKLFVIPPIYREPTDEEKANPPVPPFNARWICNYVQIMTALNEMDITTLARYSHNPTWLQFKESDGKLIGISVSGEVQDAILEGIEHRYHNKVEANLETNK